VAKSAEARRFQEQLAKEKAATEKALEDADTMRRKYDASKARIKVIDKNLKSLKEQMKILLAKSDDDDRLIDQLKRQAEAKASKLMQMTRAQSQHGSTTDLSQKLQDSQRALARQSQIIAKLQSKLQNVKHSTQEDFKTSVQDWDFTEKERQIQTLTKRNEKQAEILQLFNKSMAELKSQLSHSEKCRDELSRKMETLKKRLENRRTIKPVSKDQIAALTQKLNEKEDELHRLRTEYTRDIDHHHKEMEIAKEMTEEQVQMYKADRNAMQQKFVEIMKKLKH